jgi:hypothetical protein
MSKKAEDQSGDFLTFLEDFGRAIDAEILRLKTVIDSPCDHGEDHEHACLRKAEILPLMEELRDLNQVTKQAIAGNSTEFVAMNDGQSKKVIIVPTTFRALMLASHQDDSIVLIHRDSPLAQKLLNQS